METSPAPVQYTKTQDENFFRKPHVSTISFAIALLLFLLPFAELKCGSVTLMSNSGVGLATGQDWNIAMGGNNYLDKLKPGETDWNMKNQLSSGLNFFLLVAMAAGIFGIGVGLSKQEWKNVAGICAGALGCLMLIAVMVQLQLGMRSALAEAKKEQLEANIGSILKMKFTIWYYLSFAAFAFAAFISYKKYKLEFKDALDNLVDFDFQRKHHPTRTIPGDLGG